MSHIIVVDDDPTNAGLLKMLLELDGYSVSSCADIEQAIDAAKQETAAFVVDVNLARGANGLDLLKQVRQGETAAPSDTVVIMTSGDYRREEESITLGATRFLLKPYAPDVLSTALKELLTSA